MIDVNDPPTSISLVSKGIYENATAGAVVGVLQAQDEDANQSHYYQVIYSQGMFRSCLHFCHHSMPFFPTESQLVVVLFSKYTITHHATLGFVLLPSPRPSNWISSTVRRRSLIVLYLFSYRCVHCRWKSTAA